MRSPSERWLAPVDVALLERLREEPNLVRAARTLGIGRDRAVYRLARLHRLFGAPVARGRRGGRSPGATRLTALGRRLLAGSGGGPSVSNRWQGVFRGRPTPHLALVGGGRLAVGFRAREGATVPIEVEPETVVVGRTRVELSTRNILPATVETVRIRAGGGADLIARWAGRPVRVALTAGSVSRLGLAPGRRVYLYVKAVSVRRGRSATPGSPRW
jgi:molybdopterin-binding protein/molybdate transport repressor ModE-like protein